jgi:hypothetical protein
MGIIELHVENCKWLEAVAVSVDPPVTEEELL